ncbi:MAG TPA: hypothetical protein VKY27_03620 [Bacteriovoracaceae bacterium]|nr:hypothetical protein [Bacteriovoracaceae bacterium]
MQFFLKKHAPGVATHLVKTELLVSGRTLTFNFTVTKRDGSEYCANPDFGEDYSKNWGLWETDVVEAFIQLRKTPEETDAPYLEVQLSPLNQPFALLIKKPREVFEYPQNLSFTHESSGEERTWRAKMVVEVPQELQGQYLYLGLNACLGIGEREFFALNPNPEENPDFHRPELFERIGEEWEG